MTQSEIPTSQLPRFLRCGDPLAESAESSQFILHAHSPRMIFQLKVEEGVFVLAWKNIDSLEDFPAAVVDEVCSLAEATARDGWGLVERITLVPADTLSVKNGCLLAEPAHPVSPASPALYILQTAEPVFLAPLQMTGDEVHLPRYYFFSQQVEMGAVESSPSVREAKLYAKRLVARQID